MDEPLTDLPPRGTEPSRQRSTLRLIGDISRDLQILARKELELARQEIQEGITARLKAAGAIAVAAVAGVLVLAFLGLAAATALDRVLEPWASRLVVAGGFSLVAFLALAFAGTRAKRPPLAPEETKRTVREDVEWAKRQLRR